MGDTLPWNRQKKLRNWAEARNRSWENDEGPDLSSIPDSWIGKKVYKTGPRIDLPVEIESKKHILY